QSAGGANEYFVDLLLRPNPAGQSAPAPQGASDVTLRREVGRIFTRSLRERNLSAADRTYLAQGIDQAEADKRVADALNQAKIAADEARSAAAKTALWLTAAMLIGAFAASLAAIEGGQLRDGRWHGVLGGRSYRTERSAA